MHNLIFFGSDQYSALVLEKLLNGNQITINRIVTTSPRLVGRTGNITPNSVELLANMRKIKVTYYPSNIKEMIIFIKDLQIEENTIGLTASFPRLLPPALITAFGARLYNIHPSLLPQYRNVAPVPYAIAMGDTVTGVSVFEINNGIDNGQIVAQADYTIESSDTTPTLLHKLFTLGTDLFLRFLEHPTDQSLTSSIRVMKSSDLIFTRKITRESGYIEWQVLLKLIEGKAITKDETKNPLIIVRLTHHPDRTENILSNLIRALDGYEKVWTNAVTLRGTLNLSLRYGAAKKEYSVLIAGKPKPITWNEFAKYYLGSK